MMKQDKRYTSAIAETVDASGNFINSVRNPWFFIFLIFMVGSGYLISKYIPMFTNSIDKVSTRLETLTDKLDDQNNHLTKIENGLNNLFEILKNKN